jgi:copper chaperone NosL
MTSCSKGPKPIAYGKEECTFCKMTIMDKRFGCQIMNTKGKAYSFDDLSCLVGYMQTDIIKQEDIAGIYVPDYLGDNSLHLASGLQFVASEAFRSPMAGNIAAFANADSAAEYARKMNGKKVVWNQIMKDE